MIIFGLVLALAWLPSFTESGVYRFITLMVATGIAFVVGGYVIGIIVRPVKIWYGLVFGLLGGLVSFGYVLGPHWLLVVTVPMCGAMGAAGGWLAAWTRRRSLLNY
jgi:hypothetical protein